MFFGSENTNVLYFVFYVIFYRKINYNESGDNGDNNKNKRRQGTLFVKFPWVKEQNRDNHYLFSDSDFIDSDGDEPERNRPVSIDK